MSDDLQLADNAGITKDQNGTKVSFKKKNLASLLHITICSYSCDMWAPTARRGLSWKNAKHCIKVAQIYNKRAKNAKVPTKKRVILLIHSLPLLQSKTHAFRSKSC